MRIHRPLAFAAIAGGVVAFWAGSSLQSELPASNSGDDGWEVLADEDADLLDDALEARLGLDPTAADSDYDGLRDVEELLLSKNPLRDDLHATTTPTQAAYVDFYALEDDFVLQYCGLNQHGTTYLSFLLGSDEHELEVGMEHLEHWFAGYEAQESSFDGWYVQMVRYRLPRDWFEDFESLGIAVRATLDGVTVAATTTTLMIDGTLAQVRMFESSTVETNTNHRANGQTILPFPFSQVSLNQDGGGDHDGGGNTGGGLLPAEPGDLGEPVSGASDEVCMQILMPVGDLGNGRVLYEVVSAGCEPMDGGICFASCSASVGGFVVGFDPTGLLGG